jgi:hypothetical protein
MSFMKYELNVKMKYQLLIKYFHARLSCSIGNLFIDRYISKNATMSFLSSFRHPAVLTTLTTLLGTGGSTYLLRSHMIELPEYHEARMVCHISITALSQWYAQHL